MKCFVIMPFSETSHSLNGKDVSISSSEWNHIFEKWIKKAVESYSDKNIQCKRSETIQGNFVKGIIKDIYNSDITIVDLTGQKPNVYYEMGIRHSLCLGTIIITQDFNAIPSDLKSYYCFSYEYSDKGHLYDEYYKKFEKKLHVQINSVINNAKQSDNPVSDFLDLKHYNQVQIQDKQFRTLSRIILKLQNHLTFIFAKFLTELSQKDEFISKNRLFFTFLDFSDMDMSVSQLYNLEFEYLDQDLIEELRVFYLKVRRELYFIYQYWEGTVANMSAINITKLMEMMETFFNKKDELVLEMNKIAEKNLKFNK